MTRAAWRIPALLAVAAALWFSVRDLIGFRDAHPAANLPYLGYDHLWGFVRVLSLAVAGSLILKCGDRQSARTLAGALVGLGLNNNWWFYAVDNPMIRICGILNYIGIGFGLSQFIRFAATYGSSDYRLMRRAIAAAAPYIGAWTTVFGLLWWFSVMDYEPYVVYNRLFWAGWDTANILTILAALLGYYLSREGSERVRMRWVALSFCIAAFGTALHGLDRALQHHDTVWANYFDTICQLSLPLGLGYAILRHRLLDKEFVLQSALLYSLLTVLLSAGEVTLEHLSRSLVPEQGRATVKIAEFGLSLIVVISYKRFEHWADLWAERFVGHSEETQRATLRTFALERVPEFDDASALEDRLLRELEGFTGVRGVALYRRAKDRTYRRVSGTISELPRRMVQMPEPMRTTLFFPMGAPRHPSGFVACAFAEAPERADTEVVAQCISAVGIALDALYARALEARVHELEAALL